MLRLAPVAQAAPAAGNDWVQMLVSFIPILGIVLIFYVLIFLPMRRREKAHEAMIKALKAGDKVITSGGLIGTVTRLEDETIRLRLAPQVEVTLLRRNVAGKMSEESK
ncbi:MAG: preprotein translocase subunit YajC [Acidobacteria bacterium]|nr:MAG: preprotein translocase subunit YajC [Acidobacteriota bacterium]